MSYYPKNKIKTNLYTNGNEFVIESTNQPYIGFYYSLYDGNFYTGKNPNDTPTFKLKKTEVPFLLSNDIPNIVNTIISNNTYDFLKNTDISKTKLIPSSYYPQPAQNEYNLGEFQRYFVKKINESIYLEVNKDTYTAIKNKDPKYAFEYYLPFTFAWQIYGNRVDIIKTNRNTVLLTEQNLKIRGLQEFLKNQYDKFYQYPIVDNLNTTGEELQYANSNKYVGSYHIEADRGFSVGAQPSISGPQPTLFAINLDIEKKLLDNALKIIGKFVLSTPIYDVIRKK